MSRPTVVAASAVGAAAAVEWCSIGIPAVPLTVRAAVWLALTALFTLAHHTITKETR